MDASQGTIVIRPKFFPLMILLFFFKPKASINGAEVPVMWGQRTPVPVPPGRYEVAAWCPYLFLPRMGYSSVVVDVMPGAAAEVVWNAPWIVFMTGSISARPFDPALVGAHGQAMGHPQQRVQAPQQMQASQHANAQAVGASPSAWQPDPTGRHQYRWWDGTSWSPQVSDGGVTSHDPL